MYIVCFQWTIDNPKHLKHAGFFGAVWDDLESAANFT